MTTKKLAAQLSDLENTLVAGNTVAVYTYEREQHVRQVPHGIGLAALQALNVLDATHPEKLRHVLKQGHSSSISIALNHLEDLEMVKRNHNQNDRRVIDIAITQKGRDYLRKIGINWEDVITDELTDKYSKNEMKTITRFLNDVSGVITEQVQTSSREPFAKRVKKEMH